MADTSSRALMPDGTPAFTFSNVSPPESREKHKNYVFVDEHNRHRRLKVMRACASCRRRKIKCDAATTNTWPCQPCVKQSLECVPPSSDRDGPDDALEDVKQPTFQVYDRSVSSTNTDHATAYQQHVNVPVSYQYTSSLPSSTSTFFDGSITGSSVPPSIGNESLTPITPQNIPQQTFPHQSFQASPSAASGSGVSHKSETPDAELADVLRELKIDQAGVAPYIANQQQLGEVPAMEESEPQIPPPQPYPDAPVKVPVEMMPSDRMAHSYFEHFFSNIHPYVPVINRAALYDAWRKDRYSLPPLILEGIFASSAHQLGHSQERSRWLALAARHEENFRDMPRLSTIQGLILVMKARESMPKRGYYYRSWVTVQNMIQMGKDLGLHTHNHSHVQGQSCELEANECILKSRIWHTLFQLELMVGGPQGRFDFSIDLNTINRQVPTSRHGVDFSELSITKDQTYFVKLVHNVRVTAALYARIKKVNGDCSIDKDFTQHNQDYLQLSKEFPAHLQVKYPEDGSPPSIPFHYMANLQAYHLLSMIMHYRPQLDSTESQPKRSWEDIMAHCHDAATKICRLYEAILHSSGLNGLLCMVRGINFTIYTILSCTLLHLVAITSPDPYLNAQGKKYFPRHMRILEICSSSWPVPQLKVQIDSLRQAFSADLNKPFELRQNFPFGSPHPSSEGRSPHTDTAYLSQTQHGHLSANQSIQGSYGSHPITPPQTSLGTSHDYTPQVAFASVEAPMSAPPQSQWDPSGVFQHWRTAFNPTQLETPSPSAFQSSAQQQAFGPTSIPTYNSHHQQQPHQQQQPPEYFSGQQSNLPIVSQATVSPTYPPQMAGSQGYLNQGPATTPSAFGGGAQPYVTPSMWRDVVAQSSGWKRRREIDTTEAQYKRVR